MKKVNLYIYKNSDESFKSNTNTVLKYTTPEGDGSLHNAKAFVETAALNTNSSTAMRSIEVDIHPNTVYSDGDEYRLWTTEDIPISKAKDDILQYIEHECAKKIYEAKAQTIKYAFRRDRARRNLKAAK